MIKMQIKCDDIGYDQGHDQIDEINDARWMVETDDLSSTHDEDWWHVAFNELCKCHRLTKIDWHSWS